ncbi:venom allergen 2 [Solenopsis invicta]|uniref:venom allergen 2 n=1 Tax=Solenopsis invicta TaxID=13686 RepID=UPI00193E92BF|nr:venom allergen 2 [Solenopsis invicta]
MKIFVLVTSLLIFTQIIHAAVDYKFIRTIRDHIKECVKTLPKCKDQPTDPLIRADVWYCALSKYGMDYKNPDEVKKTYLQNCRKASVNPVDTKYCEKSVHECMEKAKQTPGFDKQKNIDIIACTLRRGIIEKSELAKEKFT